MTYGLTAVVWDFLVVIKDSRTCRQPAKCFGVPGIFMTLHESPRTTVTLYHTVVKLKAECDLMKSLLH